MSRFEFGGYRGPEGELPTEALPDEHADFTPALILQLEHGVDFIPEVYLSFGYTNYEVWTFGAAGGRGGDAVGQARFFSTKKTVTLSPANWTLYRELFRVQSRVSTGVWDYTYIWSDPNVGVPEIGQYTSGEIMEFYNPQHRLTDTTFSGAELMAYAGSEGWGGGGGGGGGLQIVRGLLEDLPAAVPVVVGQPGVQGTLGQFQKSGLWTPMPEPLDYQYDLSADPPGSPYRRMHELYNYFDNLLNHYPVGVRTSFGNPTDGSDGGASSFGGTLCRASGGKHGQKSVIPVTNAAPLHGSRGGDGGVGGRTAVGGGAVGGTHSDTLVRQGYGLNDYNAYPTTPAGDGTWDGEIGQGGGGGQSGVAPNYNYLSGYAQVTNHPMNSGNGGNGSYDAQDPTVYGPGGSDGLRGGGSGGGAHRSNLKFGSFAADYIPAGGVLIRLYQQS